MKRESKGKGKERGGEGGNRIVEQNLFNHQANNNETSSDIKTGSKIETAVYRCTP